jgi:hypothetical protein
MKRKLYLIAALALTVIIASASFAYTQTSASTSLSISAGSTALASITMAKPATGFPTADKYAGTPTWTPISDVAGNVTAGHMYYIDPGTYTGELWVTMYLTNVGDLAKNYSYLNLGVNFYTTDGTAWAEETAVTGTAPNLNYYLTLSNGFVSFRLPAGSTKGVLTIDNGDWYCTSTTGGSLSPRFYLDIK